MKPRGATRRNDAQVHRFTLGNRARQAMVFVFLMTVTLYGFYNLSIWIKDPSHLPIRTVQIVGDLRYLKSDTLQQVVAEPSTGGFFTVDVNAIREAARELPWVDRASVRRVWPDTIRVQVSEQVPVARWGKFALLNARGEVFVPEQENFPEGLPELSGPDGQELAVLRHFEETTERLAPTGLTIRSMERNERGAWQLRLENDVHVTLGRQSPFRRLWRFVAWYPQIAARGELIAADLRYSNGLALRYRVTDVQYGNRENS